MTDLIDLKPAAPPLPPAGLGEMLKQQFKLGVALKKAQDARLVQLQRQVAMVDRELAAPAVVVQRRSELQRERETLTSQLAVRQQYVDKATQLRDQGRDPELAALIFYQGLDAYCGDADQYNPHVRREYRYVGKRGTVEQQDLELLEIATNLVEQPSIKTFSEYTAMFPHLLKNHCQDDDAGKADFLAKERLRLEAEKNATLKIEQEEWWQKTGKQKQIQSWYTQTALPLIEREKAASNYAGKSPSEQQKLAASILKSVGMSLSQAWLREKNTSQLGIYPPFWQTLIETGVYSDEPTTSQTILLDDVLPNWNFVPPPPPPVSMPVASDAAATAMFADLIEALRLENNTLNQKLATQQLTAVRGAQPDKEGDAAKSVKKMERRITKLRKQMAAGKGDASTEYEMDRCSEILRDTLDLVRNKYSRNALTV